MKTKLSLIAVSVLISNAASGADLQATGFHDDPFAFGMYTFVGETDYKDDAAGGRVQMQEAEVSALLPVWSMESHNFLVGVFSKWNRFEFTEPAIGDEDLYGLAIPVAYLYDGESPWGFWVHLSPGVYSDTMKSPEDHFKMQFHALATYELMPSLNLALGGAYDSAFGEDRLYPMGGAVWRAGEEWLINLLLPYVSAWWKPAPDWALFADVRPAGDKWKVRGDDDGERLAFTLETWRLGLGLERRIWKGLWAHVGAGADVGRKYEFERDGQTVLDADVDDGWFARAGIALR